MFRVSKDDNVPFSNTRERERYKVLNKYNQSCSDARNQFRETYVCLQHTCFPCVIDIFIHTCVSHVSIGYKEIKNEKQVARE